MQKSPTPTVLFHPAIKLKQTCGVTEVHVVVPHFVPSVVLVVCVTGGGSEV